MSDKCVHTEHCCAEMGCKYGDYDCPVWLGYKKQSFPYWSPYDPVRRSLPEVSEEEFNLRREEAQKSPVFSVFEEYEI